jgi:hypothetical protein
MKSRELLSRSGRVIAWWVPGACLVWARSGMPRCNLGQASQLLGPPFTQPFRFRCRLI